MSDIFQNPEDQANLDALRAQLARLDADINGAAARIEAEAAAIREQRAQQRFGGGTAGGGRTTASALPSLQQEVEAVNEQVVSYERLNQLIADRIKLEARAASAVRETATATSGTPAARGAPAVATAIPSSPLARAATSRRMAASDTEAAAAAELLAMRQGELDSAVAASTASMVRFDDSMSKTGGLSGAALKALADGSLTVKDLGNQVAQTIGKFGGWALAGAAVYGVIGALSELKKGAVDVSSSVTGLTKFIPAGNYNPDQARQQIINEGRATATPLNDVGQVAQQFGKAFHDQTDVFTATHVALTAAKLDNISLADSYKFLTAIVQESGVSVSKLPGIFDQITAAQDRLGARVATILPAFSGAVGSVVSSGGDPTQLLGLQALTAVRTGFDGSVIANMFRQGAGRYFNTAQARGVRSRYGIGPDTGFTQALIEAIQKGQDLPGVSRQDLATGFFGPRFGPRSAPLFRANDQQLQEFLKAVQPGESSGLANKQLGTTVSQANNQLSLLKVNLQAIGAELTGSKMTTPFSALLHVLNDVLTATGNLMHAWDELPGPVKELGSDLGAVLAIIGLMRRFNIGAIMEGSSSPIARSLSPVFSRNPQKVLDTQVNQYMDSLSGTVRGELQSSNLRLTRANLRAAQVKEELAQLESQGVAQSDEAYILATKRAAAAQATVADARSDVAFYSGELSPGRQAEYRAAFMNAAGGGGGGVPPILSMGGAGAEGGALTASLRKQQAALGERAAAEEVMLGETTTLTTGLMGLNTAAIRVSEGMSTLAGMAIPALLGALAVFDASKQSVSDTQRARSQGLGRIENAKSVEDVLKGLGEANSGGSFRVPLLGFHLPNLPGAAANTISGQDLSDREAAAAQIKYLDALNRAFNAQQPLLGRVNAAERSGNNRQAFNLFRGDRTLQSQNQGEYDKTFNELYTKMEGSAVSGKGGSNPFAMWEKASQDLTNQLEPMMQAIGNAAKVFGTSQGNLSSLANGYMYAVERFGKNASDTKAMQALATAQQDLVTATDKQVQDLVNLAQMATSDRSQRTDYQKALQAVGQTQAEIKRASSAAEKLPGADVTKIRAAEQEALGLVAAKRQSAIQGLMSLVQSETDLNVSKIGGIGPAADLQRAEAQLRGMQTQLVVARQSGADAQTLNELMAKVNQQVVTVLQDRVNYLQQLSQAETQYQQAGTADPVQQQAIAISQLSGLYTQLQSAGADRITLLGVLGQIRGAQQQQVSDRIGQEQAQSQADLSHMNIGQPQQVQLQNAVTVAQRELSYLTSLPRNQVNPTTLIQAYNNLYQAQGALAQYAIQQGQQMISATTQLKQAQTFDPVKIAQIALEGAKQLLAYDQAHNMSAAQIQSDMAQVAADGKAVLSAEWQKKEATIEFLAQTYQITGAQEILRLKKLYQGMKKAHASYQDLQGVAQQIWNLEFGNTGNLNLNTGSIHLPSTYEVKSAIAGARGNAKRRTTAGLLADVKTNVNLTVYVNKNADWGKLADTLHHALGTSVDGLAKAAGMV